MLIDGGGSGVTAEDDRKIQKTEWVASLPVVHAAAGAWANFVRLQTAAESDFTAMDADGKGEVLLHEFCAWVQQGEIEANTEIGKDLKIQTEERPVTAKVKKEERTKAKVAESLIEAAETPAPLAGFLAALN